MAMSRLADGDLATAVPGTDRRDEVGEMAAAVLVFQEHMLHEQRITTEREEERQQAAAEKASALTQMANTIETETSRAMAEINSHVAAMNHTAHAMQASAARTGASAESAAASASETLATTQTVASAARHRPGSRRNGSALAVQPRCGNVRRASSSSRSRQGRGCLIRMLGGANGRLRCLFGTKE
jgi:methyl-accepting chemotaxis protein